MKKINSTVRQKNIVKVSAIGIITNVLLVAAKAVVGIIANSIAIILDAVNNLTDAISSVVTLIGVKLSKRNPTKKHPYGFGRIEYFSSLIIGAIILATGILFIKESIEKIITPTMPEYGWPQLIVIALAIVVKLALGIFTRIKGKKYSSDALMGSGIDAILDAIISTSTLIAIIVAMTTNYSIDGIVGVLISIFVLRTGITIILTSASKLIGIRPDANITKQIKEEISKFPNVIGAFDLVIHNYGPDFAIGSVHVEVDNKLGIDKFHILTTEIQNAILKKYDIFLTVGLYSVNANTEKIRKVVKDALKNKEGILSVHGVFINQKEKRVSLDIGIDFALVKQKNEITKLVEKEISKIYPNYTTKIVFDMNYSDF